MRSPESPTQQLFQLGKKLWEAVVPTFPEYSAEQITSKTVASIIRGYIIGMPNARVNQGMQPEERVFTINTVLAIAGYPPTIDCNDQMKLHPKEYRAARQALRGLTGSGILTVVELQQPSGNENYGYVVTDYQKLIVYLETTLPNRTVNP
jgi:hypothetical protein